MKTQNSHIWASLLLALSFMYAVLPLSAQSNEIDTYKPGFVILASGERLDGWVLNQAHSNNVKYCEFRKSEEAASTQYLPKDIQSYGIGEERLFLSTIVVNYKLKTISDTEAEKVEEQTFVEYLLKGEISLLYRQNRYFLLNEKGVVQELYEPKVANMDAKDVDRSSYKFVLRKQMIAQCLDMDAPILSTQLRLKSLKKLFTRYYDCANLSYQEYGRTSDRFKLGLALTLGIESSQFDTEESSLNQTSAYTYLQRTKSRLALGVSPGILLKIYYPELIQGFSIRTGILFTYSAPMKGDASWNAFDVDYTSEIEFNMMRLEIPIQFRIQILDKKMPLFLVLGSHIVRTIDWYFIRTSGYTPLGASTFTTTEENTFLARKGYINFPLILETELSLNDQRNFLLGLGYKRSTDILNPSKSPVIRLNHLLFYGGISF